MIRLLAVTSEGDYVGHDGSLWDEVKDLYFKDHGLYTVVDRDDGYIEAEDSEEAEEILELIEDNVYKWKEAIEEKIGIDIEIYHPKNNLTPFDFTIEMLQTA